MSDYNNEEVTAEQQEEVTAEQQIETHLIEKLKS
mgnify:CR=1 FL=1